MTSLPVFSAIPPVSEFDRREDLPAAVAGATPTSGRLVTPPTRSGQVASPKRNAPKPVEPASGFSMSGFG